jgi:hypothetical protein
MGLSLGGWIYRLKSWGFYGLLFVVVILGL